MAFVSTFTQVSTPCYLHRLPTCPRDSDHWRYHATQSLQLGQEHTEFFPLFHRAEFRRQRLFALLRTPAGHRVTTSSGLPGWNPLRHHLPAVSTRLPSFGSGWNPRNVTAPAGTGREKALTPETILDHVINPKSGSDLVCGLRSFLAMPR